MSHTIFILYISEFVIYSISNIQCNRNSQIALTVYIASAFDKSKGAIFCIFYIENNSVRTILCPIRGAPSLVLKTDCEGLFKIDRSRMGLKLLNSA